MHIKSWWCVCNSPCHSACYSSCCCLLLIRVGRARERPRPQHNGGVGGAAGCAGSQHLTKTNIHDLAMHVWLFLLQSPCAHAQTTIVEVNGDQVINSTQIRGRGMLISAIYVHPTGEVCRVAECDLSKGCMGQTDKGNNQIPEAKCGYTCFFWVAFCIWHVLVCYCPLDFVSQADRHEFTKKPPSKYYRMIAQP